MKRQFTILAGIVLTLVGCREEMEQKPEQDTELTGVIGRSYEEGLPVIWTVVDEPPTDAKRRQLPWLTVIGWKYDGGKNTDWGLMTRLRITRHSVSGFDVFGTLSPPEYCVRLMDAAEREETRRPLQQYNAALADEDLLRRAFERHVHRRFLKTYFPIMRALPERIADPEDRLYRRLWQNYFVCPTHQEFLATAFRMLREGTIDLVDPSVPEAIV